MKKDEIFQTIINTSLKRAIEEVPHLQRTLVQEKTPLFGVPDAILDSLNLITFVFIVEEEFQRFTGKVLKFTTRDILNTSNPPFSNLGSLAQFLENKLCE
jgi:hypothetical protein